MRRVEAWRKKKLGAKRNLLWNTFGSEEDENDVGNECNVREKEGERERKKKGKHCGEKDRKRNRNIIMSVVSSFHLLHNRNESRLFFLTYLLMWFFSFFFYCSSFSLITISLIDSLNSSYQFLKIYIKYDIVLYPFVSFCSRTVLELF